MNQWPLTDVVATYFRPSGSICLSVQSFARKALVAFVTSCRTRPVVGSSGHLVSRTIMGFRGALITNAHSKALSMSI